MTTPTHDSPTRASTYVLALWQLPSAGLAGAVWLVLLGTRIEDLVSWATVGLALVLAATGMALVQARQRVPRGTILVPAASLAGAVAINYDAADSLPTAVLLAAPPVIWLAFEHDRRGLALSGLGVSCLAFLPYLLPPTLPPTPLAFANMFLVLSVGMGVIVAARFISRTLGGARRRLVEEAQRLTQELDTLDAVMQAVDVGVMLVMAGQPARLNQEAQRFRDQIGTDKDELGHRVHVYERDGVTPVPHRYQPGVRAEAGESFRGLMHFIGPPDQQIAVLSSCQSIRSRDGTRLGSVLVGVDATDLLDAVRVRSDFLATVSHELRTPLTSITASLELLLDEMDEDGPAAPSEVAQRLLRSAARNSVVLVERIDQLLNAAPNAVEDLRFVSTDVTALINEALVKHHDHAVVGEVDLTTDIEDGVLAEIDPVALERIVDNLVSNALKYTASGGRVCVRMRVGPREAGPEDRLRIAVEDSGVGMTPAEQHRVFERFYRSSTAVESAVPGIGLGMTITQRLVRLHHGHIHITSARGCGTTISVDLPRTASSATPQLAAEAAQEVGRDRGRGPEVGAPTPASTSDARTSEPRIAG